MITLASQLAKIYTPRASVIPYMVIDDQIFFLLGKDQKTGEITDLGGGVKKYESALAGALREFTEESNEILGKITSNDFSCAIALLERNKMGVIFIPLDKVWLKAPQIFEEKKRHHRKKSHSEIESLIWIHEKDFQKLFDSSLLSIESSNSTSYKGPKRKMWNKLCKFYKKGYGSKLRKALYLSYPEK